MPRAHLPGARARSTECLCHTSEFNCHMGRDCPVRDTELANDIGLDATRTFAPLPYEAPPPPGRTLAWTVLALALIGAGVLMLLAPGPAHSHALVWVSAPIQVTGGPIPLRRRLRHFLRAWWQFLKDPKCRL